MSKRKDVEQSGFTMAELLVTMVLLSTMLVGLAALQAQTIRRVTFSRRSGEALRLTQAVLERYKTMDYANLPPATSPNWLIQPRKDGTGMIGVGIDGEGPGPFTVQYVVESFQGGALITVDTTWVSNEPQAGNSAAERYRIQRVSLSTLRFP